MTHAVWFSFSWYLVGWYTGWNQKYDYAESMNESILYASLRGGSVTTDVAIFSIQYSSLRGGSVTTDVAIFREKRTLRDCRVAIAPRNDGQKGSQ